MPDHGPLSEHPSAPALDILLPRAVNGDQQAWRAIVESYAPRVFALLRAQCGDEELAEEITQSTFCTMAAKISTYSEVGKFDAWIFRIAMNRLRDEMRRRRRQARPVEDDALTAMAGASKDDEAGFEPAELASLRNGLTQLSEAEQYIIHLRWHAMLSFKQIAEQLDQPLGTILAKHHRALKRLRDILTGGSE